MKKLTQQAVSVALDNGASYADIRIVTRRAEKIHRTDGQTQVLDQTRDHGFGVRVLADGAWGFDCSPDVTPEAIARVAMNAVSLARDAARLNREPVVLAPVGAVRYSWSSPRRQDPFAVPLAEKMRLLQEIEARLNAEPQISRTVTGMGFESEHKLFASSEGSFIEQDTLLSTAGYAAVAADAGMSMTATFNSEVGSDPFQGFYRSAGYEAVSEAGLVANVPAVAARARTLVSDALRAEPCPTGKITCFGGADLHHSMGHPVELDRMLGMEANFAGTTFVDPADIGRRKLGSDLVNITINGNTQRDVKPDASTHELAQYFSIMTNPGRFASPANYAYDDEGVKAEPVDIVRNGVLVGCLNSRETALRAGQKQLTASMRAHGWNRPPILRMHNMHVTPGTTPLRQLIEETEHGLLIGPSIPGLSWGSSQSRDRRYTRAILGLSWEVKNGRIVRPVKGGNWLYESEKVWSRITGVSSETTLFPDVIRCGKGQPHQSILVCHLSPIIRYEGEVT